MGLLEGLEHCFCHRSLLEQVSFCYQIPPYNVQYLKENVPHIETLKAIPLDRYESLISPWAKTIEDEEYVFDTYDILDDLIDDDPEVAKMLTFSSLPYN